MSKAFMMISDHPGDDDNHQSPYFDADMGKLNGDIADVDVGQHGQQVGEAAGIGTLDCHQDRQFDQHDNHHQRLVKTQKKGESPSPTIITSTSISYYDKIISYFLNPLPSNGRKRENVD